MSLGILVTVGISIFTNIGYQIQQKNFNTHYLQNLQEILSDYRKNKNELKFISPVILSAYLEDKAINSRFSKDDITNEIVEFICADLQNRPNQISAELNSIYAYKKSFDKTTSFYLVYTDTYVGEICARVLDKFLTIQIGSGVELVPIPGLSLDANLTSNQGLYNYTKIIFEKIYNLRKKEHKEVIIIATGGFKDQIPYTILQAIFSGSPVYYFHQGFEEMIQLPHIPIVFIDMSIITQNVEFLNTLKNQWINERDLMSNWQDKLKAPFIQLIIDKEKIENQIFYKLSLFGNFLLEIFNAQASLHHRINIAAIDGVNFEQYFAKTDLELLKSEPVYLLFTTGISLLTQAILFYLRNKDKIGDKTPMKGIIAECETNLKNTQVSVDKFASDFIESWTEEEKKGKKPHLINDLLGFLNLSQERNQLTTTCAELNTLKRLVDENYISDKNIRGNFLASDTFLGEICGEALSDFCNRTYANRQKMFKTTIIHGLNYEFDVFRNTGLNNLIKEIIHETIARKDFQVIMCATGGFKAETAYATLLGILVGKPVFYIHENQKNIIYFPAIPIVFDFSRIIRYFDHLINFQWGIDQETYNNYFNIWRQNNDNRNMELFLKEITDRYYLNDAGNIILEMLLHSQFFQEILKLEYNFIQDKLKGSGFIRPKSEYAEIFWRPEGPPEPEGDQGVNPLKNFLRPILNRIFVSHIQDRHGGIGMSPHSVSSYSDQRWPKYLPNNGGGNIQVKYEIAVTLVLTIFFNQLVKNYQEELEIRLADKIQEILDNLFEGNVGHKVQIKLPNNYLNEILVDNLIEVVNSGLKEEEIKDIDAEKQKVHLIPKHCIGCCWINPHRQTCNRGWEESYGFNVEIDQRTGLGVCYKKGEWVDKPIKIIARERKVVRITEPANVNNNEKGK